MVALHSAKGCVPEKLKRSNKLQPDGHLLLFLIRLLRAHVLHNGKKVLEDDKPQCNEENPSRQRIGENGRVIHDSVLLQDALDGKPIHLHSNRDQSQAEKRRKVSRAVRRSNGKGHDARRQAILEPTNPIPAIGNHGRLVTRSQSIRRVEKVSENGNHEKGHECTLHIKTCDILHHHGLVDVAFGIKGRSARGTGDAVALQLKIGLGLGQCKDDYDSHQCHDMCAKGQPIAYNQVFHLFRPYMHTCTTSLKLTFEINSCSESVHSSFSSSSEALFQYESQSQMSFLYHHRS